MKFYLRVAAVLVAVAVLIWLLQEFGQSSAPSTAPAAVAAAVTPAPTATPVTAAPVQVVQTRPTVPAFIPQAAAGAHVQISGTQQNGDWWYITVVGRDRNQLSDFLDMAMKMGLRDVDVNYQAYKEFLVRGEQRAQNTYKMRF